MDGELTLRQKAEDVMAQWRAGVCVGEPGLIDAIAMAIQRQSNEDLARHWEKRAALETELASLRNLYAAQEERYERGRKDLDYARDQLAAANERCAEMAAGLDLLQSAARDVVTSLHTTSARCHISPKLVLHLERSIGDTPSAILAAVREEAKREGAVEELRGVGCTCPVSPRNPGFQAHFRWCPMEKIAALEAKG